MAFFTATHTDNSVEWFDEGLRGLLEDGNIATFSSAGEAVLHALTQDAEAKPTIWKLTIEKVPEGADGDVTEVSEG